jgi:hypothetical protein
VHWSFEGVWGDSLTYELAPVDFSPLLSDLTIDPNSGIITFTSLDNAHGSLDIQVRAEDAWGFSEYKTFTFEVIPVDDRPIAEEQVVTVDAGGSVTFKVYGYDYDNPGTGEWRFDYTTPADLHGTLTPGAVAYEGNGMYSQEFTFIPGSGYNGRDSFDFTFYTNGPGTLTDGAGTDIGSAPGSGYTRYVELSDVDGDGDLDLITGTKGGPNDGNKVYYYDQALEQFVDSGLGFGTNDTRGLQVVDINGDDLPDVVEANDSDEEVKFYINQGGGSDGSWGGFVYGGDVGTDSPYDYSVAVGDINHDGWLDVVATGQSETRYYLSNGTDAGGNLSFANGVSIGSVGSPPWTYEVALADVNNDGWLDVVEGNATSITTPSANTVYLNTMDGSSPSGWFEQTGIDFGGGTTRSIALGDVNGDGFLDVVAGNGSEGTYETNQVFINQGVGATWNGFDSGTDIGTDEQNTYSIRLGDVNGDGMLDVVTGNRGDADDANGGELNRVYLNDGAGNFPGAQYTGEGTPWGSDTNPTYSLALGDVNGDGWLDLVTGNRGTTEKLYLNEAYEYSDSAKVFFIDSYYDPPVANPQIVWMSYSEASVTFKVTGYDPDFHDVADISFDVVAGGPDYADSLTPVGTVQYEGDGLYSQTFTYDPVDYFWGSDEFQFTVTTSSGGWTDFASGQGLPIGVPADAYQTFDMGLVDLNQDGKPDILVTANGGDVVNESNMFYTIDQDGQFGNGQVMDAAGQERGSLYLAVGDLNGDGFEDVVVHNSLANDVYYLWNPTENKFDAGVDLLNSNSGDDGAIAIGDINSDGNPDIVVGISDARDRIYLNQGNGTFDAGAAMDVEHWDRSTGAIAVADMDNDGYDDIVVSKWNWRTVIYWNNQQGGFDYTDNYEIWRTGYVSYMDVGDVDADGDIDIVVGTEDTADNNRAANFYFRNLGNGTFAVHYIESSTERDNTENIRLADLNGDGYLDVVVTNDGDTNKYYLYNPISNGRFNLPGVDIGDLSAFGDSTYGGIAGDVNGDGDIDYITGLLGDQNRVFENLGFVNGTTVETTSSPALVTVHVGLLENWSFEDEYTGWSWDERTVSIDPEEFATFGVVENGTTIDNTMTVWDYKDGVDQIQYWTYLGGLITHDSIIIQDSEADDGENVAVLLSSLGPQRGIIYQDVIIPDDPSVIDVFVVWRMSYWNMGTNGTIPSFNNDTDTEQYIALYIYDPTGAPGTPVWITTDDNSDQVVSSMREYRVRVPAAMLSGQVRIGIEMTSKYDFLEMAVDDFRIVPVRDGAPAAPQSVVVPGPPMPPFDGEPPFLVPPAPAASATVQVTSVPASASTMTAPASALVTTALTPVPVIVETPTFSDSGVLPQSELPQSGSGTGLGSLSLLSTLETFSAEGSALLETLEVQANDTSSDLPGAVVSAGSGQSNQPVAFQSDQAYAATQLDSGPTETNGAGENATSSPTGQPMIPPPDSPDQPATDITHASETQSPQTNDPNHTTPSNDQLLQQEQGQGFGNRIGLGENVVFDIDELSVLRVAALPVDSVTHPQPAANLELSISDVGGERSVALNLDTIKLSDFLV